MRRWVAALATAGAVLLVAGPALAQEPEPGTTTTSSSTTTTTAVPLFPAPIPVVPALPPPPATPGSGVDGLLRPPPGLGDGHEPTFYERYSPGAYTLDIGSATRDPASSGLNAMAAALWAIAVWVLDAAIKAAQWAFHLELLSGLTDAVERIVGALRTSIFDSYLGAALALAAGWAAWHGLVRRRAVLVAEGMAWTVFALVIALVFLAKPGALLTGVDGATTGIARAAYGGVAGIAPDAKPDDGVAATETYGRDAADNALRRTGDRLWRVTAYQPWAIMELGSLETASDIAPGQQLSYGERLLAVKTFTPPDLARLAEGSITYEELRAEKATLLTELRTDLAATHPDALPWLDGERAAERLGVSAMALVAAVLFGGLLLLLAGAVVVTQLALLLLTVGAPAFLVLGVMPGRGRLMTVRWLELFVATAIKRVLFGVVLAVVLVLSVMLLGVSASLGWGVAVALEIGLVACVVVYRKAFASLFSASRAPASVLVSHANGGRAPARSASAVSGSRRFITGTGRERTAARSGVVRDGTRVPGGLAGLGPRWARTSRRRTATTTAPSPTSGNGEGSGNGFVAGDGSGSGVGVSGGG
ncbi:MAG: hypothetical protein ACRD0U_06265 [Acidimicrobiales bacterium]